MVYKYVILICLSFVVFLSVVQCKDRKPYDPSTVINVYPSLTLLGKAKHSDHISRDALDMDAEDGEKCDEDDIYCALASNDQSYSLNKKSENQKDIDIDDVEYEDNIKYKPAKKQHKRKFMHGDSIAEVERSYKNHPHDESSNKIKHHHDEIPYDISEIHDEIPYKLKLHDEVSNKLKYHDETPKKMKYHQDELPYKGKDLQDETPYKLKHDASSKIKQLADDIPYKKKHIHDESPSKFKHHDDPSFKSKQLENNYINRKKHSIEDTTSKMKVIQDEAAYNMRHLQDSNNYGWNKVHNWSSFQDMLQLLKKKH